MTDKPLSGVLRIGELGDPYLFVGLAGRIAAIHEHDSPTNKLLDGIIGRTALRSALPAYDPATIDQYREVKHWHGTGRFKYSNGGTIDVLSSIATTGYILPRYDAFDLSRPMRSVSLARSRAYARAYADMHGRGEQEQERYGSSLFWACAFLGGVAVEASKETKIWRPSGYNRMMQHLQDANAIEWYRKMTRQIDPTIINLSRTGSDIPGNYPIIFGVRSVVPAITSRAVALHEIRTEQPIDLDNDVTHIEVPRWRIPDTQHVIQNLPILAIEDGERIAAGFTFSEHIHGLL